LIGAARHLLLLSPVTIYLSLLSYEMTDDYFAPPHYRRGRRLTHHPDYRPAALLVERERTA